MAINISNRVNNVAPSQTLSISAIASKLRREGKDVINLSAGQPDIDTPDGIKEVGIDAIREGLTKYTVVDGILRLREAIAEKFRRQNRLDYEADQILVSCGAKQSLYNLFQAVINPGDEVIIPAPYWVSYPEIVKLAEGVPVIINVGREQSFKIDPDNVEAAVTPRTKALILNSPNNPTGAVYSADELKALSDMLLRHPDVMIVSDDIYEHIVFGGKPFNNVLTVCPELYERSVLINGVSKAYSMTGWRIGYAAGTREIISAMKLVQSQSTSNPTSISQYAALEAISGSQDFVKKLCGIFEERHDFTAAALDEMKDVEFTRSAGSFYIFPNISRAIEKSAHFDDDLEFSRHLLSEFHVATVPGTAFGTPGYVRISYCVARDRLEEGLARFAQVLHL